MEALSHVIEHHGVHVVLCCKFCNRFFLDLPTLEEHHTKTHRKEYPCQFCDVKFFTKHSLTRHQKTHTEFVDLQKQEKLKCPYCGLVCDNIRTLSKHKRSHQRNLYTCEICGRSHPNGELLEQHRLIHSAHKRYVLQRKMMEV